MNGETRIMEPGDFRSTHTPALARSLLGKRLVVATGAGLRRHTVTEVEAYHGPDDRASHASRGITPRNRVMFGPGGHWYVYLCYGVHEMLNLVTGPEGFPAAILIRGLETVSGPGRLTRQLGLDRRFNARPAVPSTGLYLEDPGIVVPPDEVMAGPRIGVDYAGPDWAAKPYRFLIAEVRGGKAKDPAGR